MKSLQKENLPQAESLETELEVARKRVYIYRDNIICYKELVQATPLQIQLAGERLRELGKSFETFYTLIDLTEAKPPTPEQRVHLKKAWHGIDGLEYVVAFTGKNFLLNMAAKFVIGTFGKSFSVYKTMDQCLNKLKKLQDEKRKSN